ncbi:MAG: AAA family ATPase [Clostridia bacterium]|nr:AAA family ATPase [Clostridia bacterium]
MAVNDRIKVLQEEISQLPKGYISQKNIQGKTRYYLQWSENGKKKSKYIKDGELEHLREQIEHRKALQEELKELQNRQNSTVKMSGIDLECETNITVGRALLAMTKGVAEWERRDCYEQLQDYLHSKETDRVCLIYGLRRTGKTTMLRQAVSDLSESEFNKAAYIKLRRTDTMAMLNRDLKRLFNANYQYIFLDEVTLMSDFIDSAALLSDVFAAMGMKIVLSGTDSLGFSLAMNEELYDRAISIHTTFIPFREHSRLLGIDSIDEYIRYGGTLRAGELDFENPELNSDEASFKDDESTRRYIDTAICRNIQHSLACYEDGNHFHHLYSLYQAGELTNAINRIIENMNHRFVVDTIVREFRSSDLSVSAKNLRKERDPEKRTDILDRIDIDAVTEKLMEILDIRNKEDQSIGITKSHVIEIKEYLRALDLIAECPIEYANPELEPLEHTIFTQPGMRYCQAQALVYSLMQDKVFSALSEKEKTDVTERILEEVRGRMMEDIVLLETSKAAPDSVRVFKLVFPAGEFDMVTYDSVADKCAVYEIKHSNQVVPQQYRHLTNEDKRKMTEKRFGEIIGTNVIYRGENQALENDVSYLNVEEYLKAIPDSISIEESENQDMSPIM